MDILNKIFSLSGMTVVIFGAFLIAAVGYALGRITIKGVSLGTAGVFLVALLFGYLFTLTGLTDIPVLKNFFIENAAAANVKYYKMLESLGLVLFVTSVGFIAGPSFFRNLKKNAKSYVLLGVLIVGSGALICALFSLIPGIGSPFGTGILSGALTSTPGFSAAKSAVAESAEGLVSLGHAVAYPFGVVGVVLFVQLIPKFLKANMEEERIKMKKGIEAPVVQEETGKKLLSLDEYGLGTFGITMVLGIIFGSITIPLSSAGFDGAKFSLGNTGGPLIIALIIGHFGRIGRLSLKVHDKTLKVFREFGLMLFLIGAGVEGGVELVSQVQASQYGAMLLLYGFLGGVVMTTIPMFVGFFFAKKVLKISLFNNLGSITGGMTSTPALGTLIGVSGTDDVASAYAATYPVALVLIVLASQLIAVLI
jgi:aspT/yidE/ybjL antiporter duplication domain